MKYVLLYSLIINALTVLLMYVDKKKAQQHLRRIPEKTLLTCAILGGGLGMLIAMNKFHHKSRHKNFLFIASISLVAYLSILILIISSALKA